MVIVGRNAAKLDRLLGELRSDAGGSEVSGIVCDVTDLERVGPAFREALRFLGRIDLLVYCAGVLEGGECAARRVEAARRMLAVNTAGAIHFLELGAEHMVGVGRGHLAAIGSVSGDRGRQGNPMYSASKSALHTYLEGLRQRLHPSQVTVTTIKPGSVDTRMLEGETPWGAIEPPEAARRIADGLEREREEFYVPGWWRAVGFIRRMIPRVLLKRIDAV